MVTAITSNPRNSILSFVKVGCQSHCEGKIRETLESVKTNATPERTSKKVSKGAQTALAGWGIGGRTAMSPSPLRKR